MLNNKRKFNLRKIVMKNKASIKKALYAGSFDPFTNGHLDIVKRSLKVFDELHIVVAISPTKNPLFSDDDRVDVLKAIFKDYDNIFVHSWDGLTVDFATKHEVTHMVRGLRPTGDFEGEFQMASMNNTLASKVESVFFMTGEEHFFISSSLVREVFGHGGDISKFVPKEVLSFLNGKKK